MSPLTFRAEARPFPRWMGPFSPARGNHSGFRFSGGRLGTWVDDDRGRNFWPVVESRGARALADLVLGTWQGGRVLFLPNGFVVKPLPGEEETGSRVLIGRCTGSIALERPDGTTFDLANPGAIEPGDLWPGPKTTGLECLIDERGGLSSTWYHPTRLGRDEVSEHLRGTDAALARGFRKARPGDSRGRVRITARGHVITNRQARDGAWATLYVGHIAPKAWNGWEQWILGRHA